MRFTITTIIAAFILCLLAATVLMGCITSQKAINHLESKGELAKVCADKFPVKDSIIVRDSISFDSIYVGGGIDTITETVSDTVYRIITKTAPAKVVTKVVTQTKEIIRENTARVKALEIQVNGCVVALTGKDKEIEKITDSRDNWRKKSRRNFWVIIALLAALFRKPLLRLIPYKLPFTILIGVLFASCFSERKIEAYLKKEGYVKFINIPEPRPQWHYPILPYNPDTLFFRTTPIIDSLPFVVPIRSMQLFFDTTYKFNTKDTFSLKTIINK